ncbi:hypothetical protein WK03_35690 [Burkholderia cepacia]|uniref:hypothetical protein n=1 Tax=Burkholderia cepacia TaxID=292 RepID=UPI00076C5686|nr:hypothetical protein [Burkholderia cepacia]KVQ35810.1 hypothetical protein WK03_35690 [Burkholderia cepacia]
MRKMIAVALLATSSSAFALQPGNMVELNNQVETCKKFGNVGALYYRMSTQGKTPTLHMSKYTEPLRQAIENEIFGNASSYDEETAWKFGYSYCWDHIDSALRQMNADGAAE